MPTRTERDSMGEVQIPAGALYGAQTRRAMINFPISGWHMPLPLIHAIARIKRAAAQVNQDLGLLDGEHAEWILTAATEVVDGQMDGQFPVDVFQTGSGTSSNMNVNEVIANRAIQLAGGKVGTRDPVHPNDHVNMGQSSNDVVPSALHVAGCQALAKDLLPSLDMLHQALSAKADAFQDVVKIGRTHLQDATPIRMGQVFSGYAAQVADARTRLEECLEPLLALPIGGTAVGTGLNTHPAFGRRVAEHLASETGLAFRKTDQHFAAHANREAVLQTTAQLKVTAIGLNKIANDIRMLGSGPRCGIGELALPALQPGSSIMPGKVNPVICEAVMQVAAFVVGADSAISFSAATLSNYELCVAVPLMAHQLLESMRLMANVSRTFASNCIEDLVVDERVCAGLIEQSLAMCTSLVPLLGYDRAAEIAKEAHATGRTVREIAAEYSGLDEKTLDKVLDPRQMTGPAKGKG